MRWVGQSNSDDKILKKFDGDFGSFDNSAQGHVYDDDVRIAAMVDCETTGINFSDLETSDQLIEVGIRLFKYSAKSGRLVALGDSYSSFQDTEKEISARASQVNGISNEMIRGHKIDSEKVNVILDQAALIISHNAKFDRPFFDRMFPVSAEKHWACTIEHIDWLEKGFQTSKLQLLCHFHGFWYDGHRALTDADATLKLISMTDEISGAPYLLELLKNAKRSKTLIKAWDAAFEKKDLLKTRGYRWSKEKVWQKEVNSELAISEEEWLSADVYEGELRAEFIPIPLKNNFKRYANT